MRMPPLGPEASLRSSGKEATWQDMVVGAETGESIYEGARCGQRG